MQDNTKGHSTELMQENSRFLRPLTFHCDFVDNPEATLESAVAPYSLTLTRWAVRSQVDDVVAASSGAQAVAVVPQKL